MDWTQVLTILFANMGMLWWSIRQSKTDCSNLERKLDENRKETNQKIESNQKETNQILRAIHDEIKDFHARLCVIEDRNKINNR